MKKNILTIFISLISYVSYCQSSNETIKFETKYYDAKDKWVLFPKKETDSVYPYGFIYLDYQAGFTLNFEGTAQINKDGSFKLNQNDPSSMIKYRLEPYKTSDVFILPKTTIIKLGLEEVPEWLAIYQREENIQSLKDLGFHYNHVGACEKALVYLEKAYKINPHYEGLEFELAFAYNHLGQYEKAIPVLEKAIENNSKNYLFYKELGYSYVCQDKNNLAEKTILKGIKMSENIYEKSELAFLMSQRYFLIKNRKKFDEWSTITKQNTEPNSQYSLQIELMNNKWEIPRK